jgi:hypothetical protein
MINWWVSPYISSLHKSGWISDSWEQALLIGAGEALGGYPLWCSSAAFHLTQGTYRCRDRSHPEGAEATNEAINQGAWLEKAVDHRASAPCSWVGSLKGEPGKMPKQRQSKNKKIWKVIRSSPLEMRTRERFLIIRSIGGECYADGKEGWIIHHRERCSHSRWWIILVVSVHHLWAGIFVSGQSRQAFSSLEW